jgi:hypothetical protein
MRPGSPPSPERCGFTHALDDLIQVSQERVDVRFVLTKQLELEAICDLDHPIKVTSHLLVSLRLQMGKLGATWIGPIICGTKRPNIGDLPKRLKTDP